MQCDKFSKQGLKCQRKASHSIIYPSGHKENLCPKHAKEIEEKYPEYHERMKWL